MSLGTWIQLIGRASVTIVSWFRMSTGSVPEPALPCISLASQEAPDCAELHTLWTWIIVFQLLHEKAGECWHSSLQWKSDIDGVLGQGKSLSVNLSFGRCAPNYHHITLTN